MRTVANARMGLPFAAGSLGEFERVCDGVVWFARLGVPSRWDGGCARMSGWEQWPGPEDSAVLALALACADMRERIFSAWPSSAGDGQALFGSVTAAVMSRARAVVPFGLAADAWHAPTQCVWDAGFVAGLVACVLARGWLVPDDLAELWSWYEAGHWPAGFAAEPGGAPWPHGGSSRRLLVY